jgi:hypothetical protein
MIKNSPLPKNLFYYSPQRHVETLTMNPNSTYTMRLSGILGYANQFFFLLRSTSFTSNPNAQFAWQRVASFDSANVSLVGYNPITKDDMILFYAHQYDNLFLIHTGAHVHSFSQVPILDLARGSINEGVNFDGFHSLRFTTKSTLPAGSYELTVVGPCSENLRINNAVVTASRA